jgi:hypothetical protein
MFRRMRLSTRWSWGLGFLRLTPERLMMLRYDKSGDRSNG